MQLVRPGVSMVDTMKNTVIDREGVKEKFGVYPEKMIELQALVGDSTDNVPGVPGIGPKTAAQLLDEYGDLETLLLLRAGDQAAEAAREPDPVRRAGAHLAQAGGAFLRRAARRAARRPRGRAGRRREGGRASARRWSSPRSTRRVADKTGVEPAEIEPATLEIAGWPPGGGAAGARAGHGRSERPVPLPSAASRAARARPAEPPARTRRRFGRADDQPLGRPQALVDDAREERLRAEDRRRRNITASATLDDLERWVDAARERGIVAIERADDRRRRRCRPRSAASRWRSSRASPATSRSATARGDGDIFGGGLEKDQIPLDAALEALRPAARRSGGPEDRPEHQGRLAGARAPRHRDGAGRRHDADVLRARCRRAEARARPRRALQGASRPRADRAEEPSPARARTRSTFDRVPIDKATALRGGGRRPRAAALARAEAAAAGRARDARLRAAGAAAGAGARPHGAARHQGRPADPFAPLRKLRAEGGGGRGRDLRARRRRSSTSARPSSSATSSTARWAWPAARRPRPASGRPT